VVASQERRKTKTQFPSQRWQLLQPNPEQVELVQQATQCSHWLAQILVNRQIFTAADAAIFLNPEQLKIGSPLEEFTDLAPALELLTDAIQTHSKIAICGDYDADGMTSTALLLRSLRALGAEVNYAIPSRMQEGYGINERIVEEFAAEQVSLILTVDNGIAAAAPIARARELGLSVIVTDHHDLPPELPPANAILNPKLLPEDSPYRSLAGVGVAYILAITLAQQLGSHRGLLNPLLELFTLGTIADLAPLTGVNRRWVQRGLKLLPNSKLTGIQTLIQVSGSQTTQGKSFKPDTIGFRLGPRINAVGRIGDPQSVIELLTTDDPMLAQTHAIECEQANQQRQQLCLQIEQEAIELIEANTDGTLSALKQWVLLLIHPDWHHGVVGIVASRLVERYGVPVFIGTYEDEAQTHIRGSARGIPEFNVFEALQYADAALHKYGGHPAAGGFTLSAANLPKLRAALSEFAHQHLKRDCLKPLITVDAQVPLSALTWDLYHELEQLQPCGMGNSEPIFWTANVQVLEQRTVGQSNAHLKLSLRDSDISPPFDAIAWRWGEYHPLPPTVDIAYRLREQSWKGVTSLQLEIVGMREPAANPKTQPVAHLEAQSTEVDPLPTRSPLLPSHEPQLHCAEPPTVSNLYPNWHMLNNLETLLPHLSGSLLLYGYQRPYLSTQQLQQTQLTLEYDRPSRPSQTLVLWTLPPSWTHLKWLIALSKPQTIYVRNGLPQLPTIETLRAKLAYEWVRNPDQVINVLNMGQQWWISPSTIVATFRDMGYTCSAFPKTLSLEQELERLQQWYKSSAQRLGQLV
jgi:single-stranded-DNA-specific exonuclease